MLNFILITSLLCADLEGSISTVWISKSYCLGIPTSIVSLALKTVQRTAHQTNDHLHRKTEKKRKVVCASKSPGIAVVAVREDYDWGRVV